MPSRQQLEKQIAALPRHHDYCIPPHPDRPGEECGVFGVFGHEEAPKMIYLGLYALQHRGQEGAGIVCSEDANFTVHRGVGLVSDIFKPHKLSRVQGSCGIGHVRYSTFGSSSLKNVQPLVVDVAPLRAEDG